MLWRKKFDDAVLGLIDGYLKENGDSREDAYYKRELLTACRQWKENVLSPCLLKNQQITKIPGFADLIVQKSRGDRFPFPVIDRGFLENIFAKQINMFADIIERAIAEAAGLEGGIVSKEDIDLAVLTGGHSQWYSVKDTRIRGAPEKGAKSQPRKAGNFRGG